MIIILALSGIFGGYSQFTRSSTGSFQSEANQGLEDSNDGGGNLKFFGLAGDFPRFIKDFAKIATLLTDLTCKDTPYCWSLREGRASTTWRCWWLKLQYSNWRIQTRTLLWHVMEVILKLELWVRYKMMGISNGIWESENKTGRMELPDSWERTFGSYPYAENMKTSFGGQ